MNRRTFFKRLGMLAALPLASMLPEVVPKPINDLTEANLERALCEFKLCSVTSDGGNVSVHYFDEKTRRWTIA